MRFFLKSPPFKSPFLRALFAAVFLCFFAACSSDKVAVSNTPVVTRSKPARDASFSMSQKKLLEIIAEQNRLFESFNDTSTMGRSYTLSIKRRLESLWAEYLAENPNDTDAIIIHGKFLRSVGSESDSYSAFMRVDSLNPNIGVVKQQMATYEAENGLWREAYAHMKEAIVLEPENSVYFSQMAKFLLVYRQIMMSEGGYEQADLDKEIISCYARAAELQPKSYKAQLDYALAFYDIGKADWNAALGQWEMVAAMSTINVERQTAFANRARVLIELNRDDEAEKTLEAVTLPSLSKDKAALLKIIAAARPDAEPVAAKAENGVVPQKKMYTY